MGKQTIIKFFLSTVLIFLLTIRNFMISSLFFECTRKKAPAFRLMPSKGDGLRFVTSMVEDFLEQVP